MRACHQGNTVRGALCGVAEELVQRNIGVGSKRSGNTGIIVMYPRALSIRDHVRYLHTQLSVSHFMKLVYDLRSSRANTQSAVAHARHDSGIVVTRPSRFTHRCLVKPVTNVSRVSASTSS